MPLNGPSELRGETVPPLRDHLSSQAWPCWAWSRPPHSGQVLPPRQELLEPDREFGRMSPVNSPVGRRRPVPQLPAETTSLCSSRTFQPPWLPLSSLVVTFPVLLIAISTLGRKRPDRNVKAGCLCVWRGQKSHAALSCTSCSLSSLPAPPRPSHKRGQHPGVDLEKDKEKTKEAARFCVLTPCSCPGGVLGGPEAGHRSALTLPNQPGRLP